MRFASITSAFVVVLTARLWRDPNQMDMMNHNARVVTVLMADDDSDDCVLVKDALSENGFTIDLRFVEDGEELMEYLRRRGRYRDSTSSPHPNLILLDLNMPKKDGREALREIKSDPRLRMIPIVILTTSNEEEDIRYSFDMGASSFITKPESFDRLVELMQSLSEYWSDSSVEPEKQAS